MQEEDIATVTASSGLRLFLLSLLVLAGTLGCLVIVTPFLAAIAWAAILAYTSWPLHKKIRRVFGRYESAAAFTMTLLLACAVVLPILWVAALLATKSRWRIEPLQLFSRKSRMHYPPSFATFHGWALNCNSKSTDSAQSRLHWAGRSSNGCSPWRANSLPS